MPKPNNTKPRTLAYLRVSTDRQDLDNQKLQILDFARKEGLTIDLFIEIKISSRKVPKARRINELLENLAKGDILIVAELSRLGRSVGEIASLVDELVSRKIRFISIKENIRLDGNGEKDLQTTVTTTMFSLFAEVERKLISERTKAGLAAVKAKGKRLGRPRGSLGKSKLDGKEEAIKEDLKYGVAKSAIARKHGVSRTALYSFLKTRSIM